MAAPNNVTPLFEQDRHMRIPPESVVEHGGGGNNGGMDSRLTALETRFDTVLPTLATKSDIAEVKAQIVGTESKTIRWVAGIGVATVTALISILSFMFARLEVKPAPAVPPQAPIIIQLPAQSTLPPAAPTSPAQPSHP